MGKINSNHAFNEKNRRKPRILVAPLDWGLGHATRCIPVIYELLNQEAEVWLAGEGAQETLLRNEFPNLPFLPLQGYRVKYGRSRTGLVSKMLLQAPRLLNTIRKENHWLKEMVREYGFDAVIADNRFGLHHPDIRSVFMTHQLALKSPFGKWAERVLQKSNYRFINRFTCCWVPDLEGDNNLAGELSHPPLLPGIPLQYTGILSRLKKTGVAEKKHHLFISLSGPEPQRSLLENLVVNEVSHYNGTATVARGLPDKRSIIPSTNDIQFYNHLPTNEYNKEMEQAEYVICRSGYSTIMDLARLGKKSILVPTPGQPEQEYLANYLLKKKIAYSITQKKFSLQAVLHAARQFPYAIDDYAGAGDLAGITGSFISQLKKIDDIQEPALG